MAKAGRGFCEKESGLCAGILLCDANAGAHGPQRYCLSHGQRHLYHFRPHVAGAISGAVGGTVIRQNGSTGGTDIVAAWVRKKYPEASFVWVIFCLNASVAALSFFVYGYRFEPVILCLIYCYLTSSISDRILKGGKTALKFEIVTQDPQALSQRLIQELHHSVTLLSAQGMYSHTPRSMLICVVNRHQIVRFQEILAEFPNTFAYVSTVNETVGNFKRITS